MNQLFLPVLASAILSSPQDEPQATAPSATLTAKDVEGATVRTEFSFALELELVESHATQDGEDVPAEMLPDVERSVSESSSVVFEDTVQAVSDDRASRWTRTFDEIEGTRQFDLSMGMADEMGPGPISEESEFETTLEGATLQFTREDGEISFEAADGSSVEEDDMEDLEADMSFAFLLPDEEVAPGDTWNIDPSEISGILRLHRHAAGVYFEHPGGLDEEGEPESTGDFELTYKGTVESGGRTLTVIELAVDMERELTVDPGDIELMVEGGDDAGEAVVPEDVSHTFTTEMVGSGKLLWDAESGHLAELSLELDLTVTADQSMSFEIPGMGSVEVSQTDVDEGTARVSIVRSTDS